MHAMRHHWDVKTALMIPMCANPVSMGTGIPQCPLLLANRVLPTATSVLVMQLYAPNAPPLHATLSTVVAAKSVRILTARHAQLIRYVLLV